LGKNRFDEGGNLILSVCRGRPNAGSVAFRTLQLGQTGSVYTFTVCFVSDVIRVVVFGSPALKPFAQRDQLSCHGRCHHDTVRVGISRNSRRRLSCFYKGELSPVWTEFNLKETYDCRLWGCRNVIVRQHALEDQDTSKARRGEPVNRRVTRKKSAPKEKNHVCRTSTRLVRISRACRTRPSRPCALEAREANGLYSGSYRFGASWAERHFCQHMGKLHDAVAQ
jgi:hypothetical protein